MKSLADYIIFEAKKLSPGQEQLKNNYITLLAAAENAVKTFVADDSIDIGETPANVLQQYSGHVHYKIIDSFEEELQYNIKRPFEDFFYYTGTTIRAFIYSEKYDAILVYDIRIGYDLDKNKAICLVRIRHLNKYFENRKKVWFLEPNLKGSSMSMDSRPDLMVNVTDYKESDFDKLFEKINSTIIDNLDKLCDFNEISTASKKSLYDVFVAVLRTIGFKKV